MMRSTKQKYRRTLRRKRKRHRIIARAAEGGRPEETESLFSPPFLLRLVREKLRDCYGRRCSRMIGRARSADIGQSWKQFYRTCDDHDTDTSYLAISMLSLLYSATSNKGKFLKGRRR